MKRILQNLIIYTITLLIIAEPLFNISNLNIQAHAQAPGSGETTPPTEAVDNSGDGARMDVYNGTSEESIPDFDSVRISVPLDTRANYNGMDKIVPELAHLHTEEDRENGIGLEEALSNQVEPRLVLNADDMSALKILRRLSGSWMMPDFETEPEAIFDEYPKFKGKLSEENQAAIIAALGHDINAVADVSDIKVKDPAVFQKLVHEAQLSFVNDLGDVVDEMTKTVAECVKNRKIPDAGILQTISEITGRSIDGDIGKIFEDIAKTSDPDLVASTQTRYSDLMDEFTETVKAIRIDIRVLKLLIYLVTPKTQQGAGHWRIKVKRILSGYNSPKKIYSRESDTVYNSGQVNENLGEPMTAAEAGMQNRNTTGDKLSFQDSSATDTSIAAEDPNADATVSDSNGDQFNVFIERAQAQSGEEASQPEESKNISAHSDGEAVDIAEIDDIRCTLIKRTRVGRDYKSKFLQRPIKLAWQTANGYAESGAGDYYKTDMANVMKSFAGQAIKDLVGDFGGDIGDFEGDLSSASFSDIATLLGQSLFSEIINSKGTNLAGYQFGDTLEKLGGMYFADFLGLPRQMFSEGHRYDTYEELAGAIGAAAIEKRLDVPIGTFDGGNLREMLQKSGQHKFEYEMNLDRDSLDNYFKDVNSATSVENKDYLIGKAVIEKNLQLQKGSFTGKNNRPPENFSEVKDSIGKVKAEIMFKDGAYVDNALHIDLGTTDLLIKGSISPYTFAVNVGRTRLDDTAYGLQYMAARDASYELDQGAQNPDGTFQRGTFERVLDGDKTALETIGIKIMSKVFATDNSSEQRAALEQWIRTNLAKNPDDKEACQFETPVKQTIETGTPPKAKEVTITETKASSVGLHSGDLFSLLGCPDSNPHSIFQKIGSKIISDALIQQYLTPEAKFRFNLTDVNPQFHSSDPEKQFYVVRAYKIPTLLDEIKGKWNGNNKDPEYQRMKAAIDSAYGTITGLFTNSMPVVSIDQAKQTARNVSVAINKMNSDIQGLKAGSNRYIDDANWTLFKLSELSRTIAEIMAGKPLPSTDTVTINKIPDNLFSLHGDNGEANTPSVNQSSSGRSNGSSGFTTSSGFAPNKTTLMALFSRKIKPAEFFLALASDKVETSLELPQNSLIYFVQNYEKKGLGTIDSFYTAIGQAKLEEAFNMPAQYFQGSFITDAALEKPDFRNDMRALLIYGDSDINAIAPPPITVTSAKGPTKAQAALNEVTLTPGTQLRNPLYERWITPPTNFDNINSDGTVDTSGLTPEQIADVQKIVDEEHYIAELAWLKILDRPTFDYLVARAEKRYKDQIQQFIAGLNISNKDLETSVDDLIENIRVRNLNDKIRTPDQDLLFRMGLSGSLDALASDNAVAWAGASTRANQIDKMLGISQGSTRALFTGKRNGWGSGQDRISKKDKQILVAKMGISPVAIEKLISYLDGEIPLRELEAIADDITPTGDNPYLESQSADNCDAASLSEVAGNLISNNIVQKGWFYFDKDIDKREKTRGTKEEFESYRSSAQNKATYIWEIAYGIGKLAGIDTERLVPQVESFLRGEIDSAINLEGDGPAKLEKAMGVSLGSLEKLFVKAEATDVGKPLVSYKKAVGHSVAKKLITGKLFSGLGVRIDPDLFSGNELFELMHGNFSSLWSIAGSMMDQSLGLPKGSVIALLTSRTSTMRLCALGEIGGSIIGRYIGLDYVSLKGNVFHNIGRSKIEKTLGIPQNSFSGANIDDLIKNIGPVNFYIAFNYPVGNVDLSPALNAFFDPAYVSSIDGFSKDFKLKKIRDFVSIFSGSGLTGDRQTAYEKLKTDLTSRVKDTARLALPVSADIPADSAWHGAWRKGEFGGENKDEVEKFISRIDGIDDSFGLDKGVTAKLLAGFYVDEFLTHTAACGIKDVSAKDASTPTFQEENDPDNGSRKHWEGCTDSVRNKDGQPFGNGPGNDWITFTAKNKDGNDQEYKLRAPDGSCDCDPVANPRLELEYYKTTSVVTPDVYLKKISVKTLGALAAYGAMDLFDFDLSDAQKTAVVGLLTHYSNWSKDSSGRMKIYNSLSAVFSLHLDNKAGLSEGTIGRLIENPQNAAGILLPEAARRLDGALGMNSAKKWSFTGIYARYINIQPSLPRITNPNLPQIPPADQTECGAEQAELDAKEIGFGERQKEIDAWITENSNSFELAVAGGAGTSGAGGYSLTNHPLYVTKVLEPQVALNRDRNAAQAVVNLCKSGNRGGSGDLKEFPAGEARVKGFGDDCDNLKATGYIKSFLEAQCQIKENVSWALAWNWASDYASDEIHDQIWEATKQTIDMPATDIKRFFVNGDMRYFQAALMTYSANTFIDQKISRSDSQAVPEAFRTSYDMYKAWFVGIPEAEDYAADAAATQFFHPEADTRDFEETKGPNAYGDVYHRFGGNGSLIGIISDPDFHTNNPGTYRSPTTADLTAFSHQQTNLTYGQLDGSHTGSQIARSQSDAASCRDEQLTHVLNSPGNSGEEKVKNAYASTTVVEGYSIGDQMRACDYLISEDVELQNTMQSARDRVRDSFRKQVQFRMLDASLWSKDHNIYPGFTYALFEGDAYEKNVAIATYFKNGLKNGEFFGKKIDFLKNIESETGLNGVEWIAVGKLVADLAGPTPVDQVLGNCQGADGGCAALAKYISVHSENWFGFKIEPDYAIGLVTAIVTKDFGFNRSFSEHTYGTAADGSPLTAPTLGSVFVKNVELKYMNKAFTWADRQAGWRPGTAFQVFDYAKQIYVAIRTIKVVERFARLESAGVDAIVALNKAMAAGADAAKIAELQQTVDAAAAASAAEKVKHAGVAGDMAQKAGSSPGVYKEMLKVGLVLLVAEIITSQITKYLHKQIGEDIMKWESEIGLVPGTTMILIDAAVAYGVANASIFAYNALFAGPNMSFLGPAGLYAALAMFVIINLFGVYRSDLVCSADGNYPEINDPSMAADSNSGLGTWDAQNEEQSQSKTIQAAQYKAKRLILDALEMHKNPIYQDIYPSQIMTGRQEDVLAVNDSVNENICSVIGLVSIAGICGGDTRAGVWENPQTTTYTHIGF